MNTSFNRILQQMNLLQFWKKLSPVYEVENILRWRHKKIKNKYIREFFVLWPGYPLDEPTWKPEDSFFSDREALHKDFENGSPQKINNDMIFYSLNFEDKITLWGE